MIVYSLSDSDLLHTATADEPGDVWRDPVHFRAEVYSAIAADLAALVETAPEGAGAVPAKRQRLDSVAPPVICTTSKISGSVPTPSWLMGAAVSTQRGGGRGRGRGFLGGSSSRGGRGGWRGGSRGYPHSWRGWQSSSGGTGRARGRRN